MSIDQVAQRPIRADARRNFDALLVAARATFANDGSDASLEDIARQAGVGVGTLYRNFPTREALIEAVYLEEVVALQQAAMDTASMNEWDALRSWLERYVEYVGTKQVLVDALTRKPDVMQNCRTMLHGAGGPLLARGKDAGVVKPEITISDVIRMLSSVASTTYEDDDQRKRVIELAIDALRAR